MTPINKLENIDNLATNANVEENSTLNHNLPFMRSLFTNHKESSSNNSSTFNNSCPTFTYTISNADLSIDEKKIKLINAIHCLFNNYYEITTREKLNTFQKERLGNILINTIQNFSRNLIHGYTEINSHKPDKKNLYTVDMITPIVEIEYENNTPKLTNKYRTIKKINKKEYDELSGIKAIADYIYKTTNRNRSFIQNIIYYIQLLFGYITHIDRNSFINISKDIAVINSQLSL